MTFSHLKNIVEVENTGSITKAAANLYMGQPNLSKAIKELESEIGITIFKRTAKGVEPTKRGEEFLTYAKTILSQMNELESLYKPEKTNSLKFNISVPQATYISFAFTKFLNQRKNEEQISINFKETSAISAVNDVSSGEADFGIIRYQNIYEDYFLSLLKDNNLKHQILWELELSILMSENHALAELDDIPFHMLNGYIEVVQNAFEVPLPLSQIKKSAKMELPQKRIYVYERGSQFDLLQNVNDTYMWVSPIPKIILKQHNLVLKKCSLSEAINKDIIIYQKKHEFSAHEKLFIQTLSEVRDSLKSAETTL